MAGCCSSTAERARKALGAMKQLGFSKKQATPVLKRLLKLYDHNWDLIEDECYRALADAILDSAAAANHTASTSASLTHCATADDDYEAPLVKRPRLDSGQISPLSGDPQAALVLEEPKPQLATHGSAAKQVIVASSGADAGGRAANQQHSHHSSLHALRGFKNEFGSSSFQDTHVGHFVELDVASSTMGEVKMSLKCNFDPLRFSINLDKVLKMVEDKCIHSYLIHPPAFSVTNLMNEVCQCAVQLASANSEIHSDGANLQKEAVDTDIPFVKPISCMNAIDGNNNAAGGLSMLVSSGTILQNSIVARQPELALSKQRPTHDVSDISKGEERARISIVNEFGSESCPPFFNYIQKNIVFQNAFVNISIARIGNEDCCANCSANCLSSPLPCACARATGGEFAYTSEGLIRATFLDECISVNHSPENHKTYCKTTCPFERAKNSSSPDQCKGHLVRKFIKECWSKCGCTMHCGNRVVQRGITSNLQVFFTREGKGWGLRTLDELPKGSFICEYAGEILTSMELYERTVENARNAKHMHQVLLDADWGSERVLRDEEALCIDATFYGNVGRFVNHRCCDANLILIPVEVETPDHCYYHLAFFTAKKVEVFEELTWDYGIDFDGMDCPEKAFRCMCGSRYCRDLTNSSMMPLLLPDCATFLFTVTYWPWDCVFFVFPPCIVNFHKHLR